MTESGAAGTAFIPADAGAYNDRLSRRRVAPRAPRGEAMLETNGTQHGVTLFLAVEEVALLNNALDELCHGSRMDDAEFRTRTGFTRDEAGALLDRLRLVLADLSSGAS